jgi:hypothetical protein
MKVIKHQLSSDPFYFPDWDVKYLLIGTFNPEGGEKVDYYYGRTKNQTWRLLSEIFRVELDPNSPNFWTLLKKHKIACIDMIHEIAAPDERIDRIIGKGYKDTEIINKSVKRIYNTSNIKKLIESNSDIRIYSTWGKGAILKEWKKETAQLAGLTPLVSPSLAARVPGGRNKFEFMLNDWKSKLSDT